MHNEFHFAYREIANVIYRCSIQHYGKETWRGFRVRIPKIVRRYRPVSLLKGGYKMFARILAIRLRPTLTHIMHPAQSSSTAGRTIPEAVATIREATAHGQLTDSLDMASPLDNIPQEYLYTVPDQYRFQNNMVKPYENTIRKCTIRSDDQRIPITSFPLTVISSPRQSLKHDLHVRNEYFSDDGRTKINKHDHTAADDMRSSVRK
jgi:hypothetical protein